MKYERKSIPLSSLEIHHKNPRFPVAENQREAIIIMLEKQQNKLFNLAQDIAINGLNPTQLILVTPSKKTKKMFCVLEGNRRVTALKLLNNVNLIPEKHENLRRKFKRIAKDFDKNPITEVNCVVFDDKAEAHKWIKLRHTGENKGRGIVPWSAYQTARFEQRFEGKPSYALQMIDYLKSDEGFNPTLKEKLEDNIAFTSFDRLLGDPGFRSHIGLDMVNKRIKSKYPGDEIRKPLAKVISDISTPGFNVRKIYDKEKRKEYYSEFDEKSELPDKSKKMHPWDLSTKEPHKEIKGKAERSKPHSTAQKTLILSGFNISIESKRINDIFHELKKLKLDTFVNSAAVIFRVFLELSVDHFIKRKTITVGKNDNLRNKIEKVADYFISRGDFSRKELVKVRHVFSAESTIFSIDTFNAYVHDLDIYPDKKFLMNAWDNIEPFIRKIWETE